MQKITKKKVVEVVNEEIVYAAFDGMEFKTEVECEWYEADKKREEVLKRNDIKVSDELQGCLPISNGYYCDYSEYTWVMPLTKECADALQDAFKSEYSDGKFVCNEWMCIEETEDGLIDLIPVKDMLSNIRRVLDCLGINVCFEKKGDE